MKRKIRLTESQLHTIIKKVIREQELDEYGRKGLWKPEWNEKDQMLAMYNSLYGIEELGVNKEETASDIIGTSLASFNQQTSNFDFLSGKGGLSRPHSLQSPVYEKYKDLPKPEFKSLCEKIVDERKRNPEIAVTKKRLGQEIGSKREEISKGREEGLKKAGIDPERIRKMKLISSKPLNLPGEEKPTLKTQIIDYLKVIYNRIRDAASIDDIKSLADDVAFIIDYIESEQMIAEGKNRSK